MPRSGTSALLLHSLLACISTFAYHAVSLAPTADPALPPPWTNAIRYTGYATQPNFPLTPTSLLQCSFSSPPPAFHDRAVTLARPQFHLSIGASCGKCVAIRCTDARCRRKEPVRGYVVGACDDCPYGWVGVDEAMRYAVTGVRAASMSAELGHGERTVKIEWNFVDCDGGLHGGVKLVVASFSTPKAIGFVVENALDGIDYIQLTSADQTSPRRVESDSRNRFLLNARQEEDSLRVPLSLVIVSQKRRMICIELDVVPIAGQIIQTRRQFGFGLNNTVTDVGHAVLHTASRLLQSKRAVDFETKQVGTEISDGRVYNIWSNGYIQGTMEFSESTTIHVELAAQLAGDVFPVMRLSAADHGVFEDEQFIELGTATVENSNSFVTYTFGSNGLAGTRALRIEFTNDYYGGPELDRNLLVRNVLTMTSDVMPRQAQTNSTNVIAVLQREGALRLIRAVQFEVKTTGVAADDEDGSWSIWDPGYIETMMPFVPSAILSIEAKALPLEGWPTIMIFIDETFIDSLVVDTANYTMYELPISGFLGERVLRIEFQTPYHDVEGGKSRFLFVRRVESAVDVSLSRRNTTRLPAAQFSASLGNGRAVTRDIYSFDGNGLIAQEWDFGSIGDLELSIELQSNYVDGWGMAKIAAGDQAIAVINVDSPRMKSYTYSLQGFPGRHVVSIEFMNALVETQTYVSNDDNNTVTAAEITSPILGHRNLWVRNVVVSSG